MKRLLIVASAVIMAVSVAGFAKAVINGKEVYEDNCQACHGVISSTTIVHPRPARIKGAMVTFPEMTGIKIGPRKINAVSRAVRRAKRITAGTATYNEKCKNCHGEILVTTIINPRPGRIVRAIRHVPQMSGLKRTMTGWQLTSLSMAIIDAKKNSPPPPPGIDGAGLYYLDCMPCHGSINSATGIPARDLMTGAVILNSMQDNNHAGNTAILSANKAAALSRAVALNADEAAGVAQAIRQRSSPSDDAFLQPECSGCHNPDGSRR